MIPQSETLTVEFKSDRKRLSDTDLVEALVCLANTEGGELWLGVEDDGQATGLHAEHMVLTGMAGMVVACLSPKSPCPKRRARLPRKVACMRAAA